MVEQHLLYDGVELPDHVILVHARIEHGSLLRLVLGLHSGPLKWHPAIRGGQWIPWPVQLTVDSGLSGLERLPNFGEPGEDGNEEERCFMHPYASSGSNFPIHSYPPISLVPLTYTAPPALDPICGDGQPSVLPPIDSTETHCERDSNSGQSEPLPYTTNLITPFTLEQQQLLQPVPEQSTVVQNEDALLTVRNLRGNCSPTITGQPTTTKTIIATAGPETTSRLPVPEQASIDFSSLGPSTESIEWIPWSFTFAPSSSSCYGYQLAPLSPDCHPPEVLPSTFPDGQLSQADPADSAHHLPSRTQSYHQLRYPMITTAMDHLHLTEVDQNPITASDLDTKVKGSEKLTNDTCYNQRCSQCRRRTPLSNGFRCWCDQWYCTKHRLPEDHACLYNFKVIHSDRTTIG